MPNRLLQLCARATKHPQLNERIIPCCAAVTDWDAVLAEAERHGMAPLLHWHLSPLADSCPSQVKMALRLLYLRHRNANAVYAEVLREVTELFVNAGIDALVLKGAALCHTLYPEPGLRPMRDIDLLVRKEQGRQAQDLLIAAGFVESKSPRPDDHFHLPSLHRKERDVPVCIELHTGLFPDCPPYYTQIAFDELLVRSRQFDLNGVTASSLGDEDMLWHVFEHGLHMPLTYEPYKLISAADIITLVEMRLEALDWGRLAKIAPTLAAALPLLHQLSPWQKEVLEKFGWQPGTPFADAGEPFTGWPHLRLAEQRDRSLPAIVRATFAPPQWWCRMYYGISSWRELLACRLVRHPAHIWWWARLYSSFTVSGDDAATATGRMSKWKAVAAKLWRRAG
ncbi:MAG: nucleotidyltransferase family protein [Desulfobulbaceae bacterium]|nr:MAG: nucleotidyltransferase family protein [Desulfobulbaceae bacterium]